MVSIVLAMLAIGAMHHDTPSPAPASRACTMMPGRTLAVLRVEQDTMLPLLPVDIQPMSMTRIGTDRDSLLATSGTLMPAARVRLLQLDTATRAIFATAGITDRQPAAFIFAAPYRADCRTIRWTDTIPFVIKGEIGYIRGSLAPREHWINNTPVIVIPDAWYYPYPRRRGLAFGVDAKAPIAPAEAMFGVSTLLETPRSLGFSERVGADSAKRERALAWARANREWAELEPVRGLVRRAVLDPDWRIAQRVPSRLRGTYRVDFEVGAEHATWYFRTHDRPSFNGRGSDSTTASLLASPFVQGYRLVGYAAFSRDSLLNAAPRGAPSASYAWLMTNDRPTVPGNDERRVLVGGLEFQLAATPERMWDVLEAFVPKTSIRDSLMLARVNRSYPRSRRQPNIPITVRIDPNGGVRADTSLGVSGRVLRVRLERIDTTSLIRPF